MPRETTEEHVGDGQQYCTFRLGALTIGIEVQQVQEVIRHEDMTEVPLAPVGIKGLINLRGQIVTVVDLRPELSMPAEEPLALHVVIRGGDDTVSVLVNQAYEVVQPDAEAFESLPPSVPDRVRSIVNGVYKLDGRLLLVLDTAKVLGSYASLESMRRAA